MRSIRSYIVLTQEDYAKLKPLLIQNEIQFEPSGDGENIYVAFSTNDTEFKLVNELLKQI